MSSFILAINRRKNAVSSIKLDNTLSFCNTWWGSSNIRISSYVFNLILARGKIF